MQRIIHNALSPSIPSDIYERNDAYGWLRRCGSGSVWMTGLPHLR